MTPAALINAETRDAILDYVLEQATETVEDVKAGRHVDGSDLAEIGLNLGMTALGAILGPKAAPVVGLLAPMVTDMVVKAVESAERSARSAERVAQRIAEAVEDMEAHSAAIEALEATPKKELFEGLRIRFRAGRIRSIARKIARLQSYLPSDDAAE